MAESNDSLFAVGQRARRPDIFTSSGLVGSVAALLLSSVGLYNVQDRFTGEDGDKLEARVNKTIDTNHEAFRTHIDGHPDKDLDARIRVIELERLKAVELDLLRLAAEIRRLHPESDIEVSTR